MVDIITIPDGDVNWGNSMRTNLQNLKVAADKLELPAGRSFPSINSTTNLFDTAVLGALDNRNDARYASISAVAKSLRQRYDIAGEALAAKLELGGGGDIVLSLLSDSTGAPDNGWYRLWVEAIAAAYPNLRVEYALWDDAAQAYPATTVIQAGAGYIPGAGISDSFNRTSTSLNQSRPEQGGIWNGPAGVFALNGTRAVLGNSIGEIVSDAGATGDGTVRAGGVIFNMTPPASGTKQLKVFNKYVSASTHLYVLVSLAANGSLVWQVLKRINGTAAVVATGETFAYTANADNNLEISLTVAGTAVTASVNEKTVTGALVQADVDALASATAAGLGTAGGATLTGISIDSFSYVLPNSTGSGQKLTAYNGSQGGTTFGYGTRAYHLAVAGRLLKMVPVRPDLAIMNMGHNYGDATPVAYIADINQMVTALRGLYPSVNIAASSQNPRFSPTGDIRAHFDRLVALRIMALQAGLGYLPVLEAFKAQPDGGQSLVLTDGIHPNTEGRVFWRNIAITYLNGKYLTPA